MAELQKRPAIVALAVLGLSTAFLSSRYYQSSAFERPFHFSIATLIIAGLLLLGWSRLVQSHTARYEPLRPTEVHDGKHSEQRANWWRSTRRHLLPALLSPLWLVLPCLVARTVLFWRVVRTVHCSWDGLQTFLPFLISVYDGVDLQPIPLPRTAHETSARAQGGIGGISTYVLVSLVWGIASTDTLFLTERRTGAICPPGLWERMIPLAQLVMLACDALVITRIGRLRRNLDERNKTWRTLGSLFLAAAAVLSFLAFWSCFDRANLRWNVFLTSVSVNGLVLDSIAVALAIVAGIYLLGVIDSATAALFASSITVLVHLHVRIYDGTLIQAWFNPWALLAGLVVFLGAAFLLQHARPISVNGPTSIEIPFYKNKFGSLAIVAFILVIFQTILLGPAQVQPNSISNVILKSKADSDKWISRAKRSKTLDEAAIEYTRRYGIPPPPNFDKWYEYATSVDSLIIDDFQQIHTDLLPYWGVSPSLIRDRTVHLLEHPRLSIGGLIIKDGKLEVSPHIRGTHYWMMEVMQNMIEPFAQWLPDMQLAFNLDDECRVSVPFDQLQAQRAQGLKSQAQLATRVEFQRGFSSTQDPAWPREYLKKPDDEKQETELWQKQSIWFHDWSKSPIFYEWIASACPSHAPVNKFHWWNRKAECVSCSGPHMTDGVVSNWTLSGDLCHQPDLAYLHGFLSSPSTLAATHTLFPVFSQSRMHNFADILYPNPWNFGDKVKYEDEKGIPWHDKLNSVYWRGASSDGFAAHGAWQTFMRARFVHMAQRLSSLFRTSTLINYVSKKPETSSPTISATDHMPIAINVSFVDNFQRCDERDCTAEHTTFYGSPTAKPVASLDFQEHWRHRHLVDLDGAAFSGRFLPFVKSASLPYRAALFRTWWEERVHPWRHFIPLDVRLSDLWSVVSYLGGKGNKEAEIIAREGSEWARKALRKEDMRVYMFRLLLEWGRIVDDNREELGFVMR